MDSDRSNCARNKPVGGFPYSGWTWGSCYPGFLSLEEECMHSTVLKGTCIACGKKMDDTYGVAFDYILLGLKYSDDEISRMKKISSKKLLKNKKLHLVLDLDNTLIHSRVVQKLSPEEKYLKTQAHSLEDVSKGGDLFNLEHGFLVKLRPYVRTFLEEVSSMFEMYVCTMGNREYAVQVAKLLDPELKYFKSRIISREDFKQRDKKSLNLVLGQESGIVILDDKASVWNDHKDNLIEVGRYNYFNETRMKNKIMNYKSHSEKKTDERENDGQLMNVLRVLKSIHGLFFDNLVCGDVRKLLKKTRREVLMGCTLLFSDSEKLSSIWSRAEEMGATCVTTIDSSVTHVVLSETATEHCEWAEEEKRILVHPDWIHAAFYLWRRQPEKEYLR